MLADEPRIVTMGCEVDAEACPAANFEDVDDWELPDPSKMTDDAETRTAGARNRETSKHVDPANDGGRLILNFRLNLVPTLRLR